MTQMNKFQPDRPRQNEDTGKALLYRTMPKEAASFIRVTTVSVQICGMRLYRAVRNGNIETGVPIADLHDFLFYDRSDISKRHLGNVVVNSTLYEPRKLINSAKSGKPTMVYMFRDMLDLQYGLEWQLCIWLRKFLNDTAAPNAIPIMSAAELDNELDALVNTPEEDYKDLYEQALISDWSGMNEPDWRTLLIGLNEEVPEDKSPSRYQPPKPRSVV